MPGARSRSRGGGGRARARRTAPSLRSAARTSAGSAALGAHPPRVPHSANRASGGSSRRRTWRPPSAADRRPGTGAGSRTFGRRSRPPGQEQVPSDPRGRAGREQEVLVAVGSVRVQNADGEAENVANRLRQSASAGQPADNGVLTRSLQERHAPVAMHVVHGQGARIGESVRVEDAASAQPRERPESRGGSQPGRAPRRVLHGAPLQRGHVRSGRAAAAARPSRTPTPRAKDMWAPRKPLIASGRADAAVSRRPRPRFPLLRATYEATFSDSATTFPAAWTRPIRRVPPLVISLQSDRPAAAVGSDATIPSPTSRSAPRSDAPLKSSTAAIVQAPITASVASGWNGCPSQVPLSKSLSPAARIAESASRASVSATPSSPDRVSVRAANCSSVLPRDAMRSGYPGPEPICRRSPGYGQLRQEPVGQRVAAGIGPDRIDAPPRRVAGDGRGGDPVEPAGQKAACERHGEARSHQ